MKNNEAKNNGMNGEMMTGSYFRFALMLTISFVIMYAVMFLNVDRIEHVYLSLTRLYMTLLMVAPMAVLMLALMGKMYKNRKANIVIIGASLLVFVAALIFLRNQTFIGQRQYMKAMIPHHSSAIMTSKHANIKDPEVRALADSIIASQEREITQMENILKRMQ